MLSPDDDDDDGDRCFTENVLNPENPLFHLIYRCRRKGHHAKLAHNKGFGGCKMK